MGIKRILFRNIIPEVFINTNTDCAPDITELIDIPDLGESDDDIKS